MLAHPHVSAPALAHRWDIQALRGLAVVGVLLHHAAPGLLGGGYLGVDLFFVISGFLITSQILQGLDEGSFTLAGFYARRVRRLLPAAYVVLAATMLASPWLLAQPQRIELAYQHWGALAFVSNVVLWTQTGYFDVAAELKPLLHFWSLSLEEQYYLLTPVLLLIAGTGRRSLVMLAVLTTFSLLLALALSARPSVAFYMLPTRAWELGIGSVAAWLWRSGWRVPAIGRWPALLLTVGLLLVPLPASLSGHPGLNALLLCLATASLLLSDGRRQPSAPMKPWVRLGDMSYSLYLVHWPLIAFVNSTWVGAPEASTLSWARLCAGAAALPLGWLLWRGVEQPTRRWTPPSTAREWGCVLLATATMALLPLLTWPPATVSKAGSLKPSQGLADTCDQFGDWTDRPACRNAARPGWAVWGDSYAIHLVAGLADIAPGLLQATGSSCGPLPGITPWQAGSAPGDAYSRDWAYRCERFNRQVFDGLAAPEMPRVVLLSSMLEQYLGPTGRRLLHFEAGEPREIAAEHVEDELVSAARRLAEALRARGQRLVWVAPPPKGGFDAGACLERREGGLPALGAPADCQFQRSHTPALQRRAYALLDRFEREAGIPILRFEAALCDDRMCRTSSPDGLALYRDAGHLTVAGSRWLLRQTVDRERIEALAR